MPIAGIARINLMVKFTLHNSGGAVSHGRHASLDYVVPL
jgi:hypothetical protein